MDLQKDNLSSKHITREVMMSTKQRPMEHSAVAIELLIDIKCLRIRHKAYQRLVMKGCSIIRGARWSKKEWAAISGTLIILRT